MGEHLIRLRLAWEGGAATGKEPAGRRYDLPCRWDTTTTPPTRLSRVFQAPRYDDVRESLWIRLEGVPGLLSLIVNGEKVAGGVDQSGRLEVELTGRLKRTNRIELILDAGEAARGEGAWGRVAIVIRERRPAGKT